MNQIKPQYKERRKAISRLLAVALAFVQTFGGFSLTTDHWSLITSHTPQAWATVPWMINYQGRLTDATGKVITGTYTFAFRLYDAATGGTKLWQEEQTLTIVEADSGIFNVVLGAVTALSTVDFNSPMWLSVQVADDTEMSPRQRLTAVGYAMNADQIDSLDSSKFLRTDIDTSTSGKLTITRAGAAFLIKPSTDPDANTKMIELQNASGTSKFSVDSEGDVSVAGDLSVTGTMSGATSTTGTTSTSWTIGSSTNAASNDVSLLLGQSSGQESLVFDGGGSSPTSDFVFSDDVRLSTQGALRLEDDSGGDYVGLKAPTGVTTYTLTVPAAVGSANQVLSLSNTSGDLSWATVDTSTSNEAPTSASYVTLSTDGTLTAERTLTGGLGLALTDAGANGAATLAVGQGTGITVNADDVALDTASTLTHSGVWTLSGNWVNTASPWADNEVSDTLTVDSLSAVQWSALTGYPAACAAGSAVSTIGDTPTCTSFNTDTSITLDDAFDGGKTIDGATSAVNAMQVGDGIDDLLFYTASSVPTIATDGTSDLTIAPDGADVNFKTDIDVLIDTKTYVQNPAAGGLFIAQDPTAANSDGYIFLGRKSAETGGWSVLKGESSTGKLKWNGSEVEVEGDSPASMTFGNSTSKVSLTYDPGTDSIWFSKGTFAQQFRNIVKNGSFEAFSALETFVGAGTTCPPGATCGGSGNTFQGGWGNFSPDEWLWESGRVFQNAPVLFTPGTTISATNLQQDFYHGKSAVTLEDASAGSTDGPYNAGKDAGASSPGVNDAHIEQTITGLKPSTVYAVGAYLRVNNSTTAEAIVDVTGEETAASTTLAADLTLDGNKMTVSNYSAFPNNGIVTVESEQISYTGKESPNILTGLIRGFNGTTAWAHTGTPAVTFVTFAPFKHLTTSGSATPTVFTIYRGQFVTTTTATDVKLHLICVGTDGATPSNNQCRFDAVQVVEGRSVPEFQPTSIVDSGDQTLYGSLRMGRTANDRGGILTVDKALRTRGIEFFEKDPGISGQAGGFGNIAPPQKTVGSATGATMSTTGTYTGIEPVDIKVTIEAGGATFKWSQSTCAPAGCTAFSTPVTGLAVTTISGSATAIGTTGIKVYFSSSPAVAAAEEWVLHAAGANLAGQYSSFSGTATYTPGQTRIFKDPAQGLVFEDGTTRVTLSQLAGSGIGQPARNSPRTFVPAAGGGGTLDMQPNGTNTLAAGAASLEYWVEIQNNGAGAAADDFRWSTNQGTGWTGPVTITGAAQFLSNDVTVTFSPSPYNAGNIGDRWIFTAYPPTNSTAVKTITAGNGVTVTTPNPDERAIAVRLDSSPGLAVGGNGLSLLRTCADGQILKWTAASSSWGCAADANAGGTGTVTSVGLSAPAEFTVSGSPVTGSGTLTFTKANQSANLLYAGPSSGAAAAPSFRALAAADLPADPYAATYVNVTGDTMTGNLTVQKADGGLLLDNATSGGTDFWVAVNDDGDATDDDLFQIGDGLTIGTNPFLTIDTAGQVGIGIAAPTAKLHVAGGAAAIDADQKVSLEGAASSGDSYITFNSSKNYISFFVNGFEVARLKQ